MTLSNGQPTSFRLLTDEIPTRDRVEAMREIYGRTILKADLDPLDVDAFHVDMTVRSMPGLGIATGTCSQFRVHHSSQLIDGDELVLLVALSGGSVMRHRGREEMIGHGQTLLMTGAEVGLNVMHSGLKFVNVAFASKTLSPLIGELSALLMRPIPTDTGAMRLLVDYVSAIQDGGEQLTPELQQLAATHIADLAALAIGATRDAAEVANGRGVRAARLRAIKADVVANGGHRNLSAEDVAVRHRLSSRYVRKLFEGEGTSLTEFMLGQRLARAHKMLSNPLYLARAITDIAFEAGFNDLSYFNRAFRRRYGATPSEVRGSIAKS